MQATEVREIRVESRMGAKTVQSPYTDGEAIERLRDVPGNFASDLARQWRIHGRLSVNQTRWVHVLVCEHEERLRLERQAVEAVVQDERQMDGIVALLSKGGEKLKYPKLRLRDGNGVDYVLSLAGENSRHPGSVNVKAACGVYLGRITTDGLFFPLPSAQEERFAGLVDLLARLAADPEATAREHGKTTGQCCFCGLTLTDERSQRCGFGPVCAVNWGLTPPY